MDNSAPHPLPVEPTSYRCILIPSPAPDAEERLIRVLQRILERARERRRDAA